MPLHDPSLFSEWGKQASIAYLKSSSPLSAGIAKIASDNDLNPAQIKRVCETANLETYLSLFTSNRSKAMDFDIATPEKVAESFSTLESEVPVADYLGQPDIQKTAADSDIKNIFSLDSISNVPEVEEKIKVASKLHRTIVAAEKELQNRLYLNANEKLASENKIYHIIKQMVLRGDDFNKVANSICNNFTPAMKPVFANIYVKLRDEGIFGVREKLAGSPVDEATTLMQQAAATDQGVIVDRKIEVINSNHPLVQEVNTLGEALVQDDNYRKGVHLLRDKANILKGQIQDLSSSEKRDAFVKKELGEDDSPTKAYRSEYHTPG